MWGFWGNFGGILRVDYQYRWLNRVVIGRDGGGIDWLMGWLQLGEDFGIKCVGEKSNTVFGDRNGQYRTPSR